MPSRPILVVPTIAAAVVLLAGCVPNAPTDATQLDVRIADDSCDVATPSAEAGSVTFSITNEGSDVNEFYILADDRLRVVGEKENIAPGQTVSYAAQLGPGDYFTACRFQMIGEPVGVADFEVTGEAQEVSATEQERIDEATGAYVAYVESQVAELVPRTTEFAEAYRSGDDERARALFATSRIPWERIEPTAEAFGDLDPRIDYREVDALAEGLDWTGFHRMEKDLWPPSAGAVNSDGTDALQDWAPSTPEQRAQFADQLIADVDELAGLVNADDFTVDLADISNGAIGLLDEVATGKISGEEDWWSGTDLSDFAANVDGARVAFGIVRDIAAETGDEGAELVDEIDARFTELEAVLAEYGSLDAGFVPYGEVDDAQRRELSDAVNALAEPLSRLTTTVLEVPSA